jgi:hypothetical protein
MHPFHILLALFAVFSLAALVFLLRWERRYFLRLGKGEAWFPVRLATIPIALATAMLIIIPVRSTSGMEGLSVFYILLLIIAPVFWVAMHWLVGKFVRPPLRFGESVQIAVSPVALVIVLSAVAHLLQPLAWTLLRSIGKA